MMLGVRWFRVIKYRGAVANNAKDRVTMLVFAKESPQREMATPLFNTSCQFLSPDVDPRKKCLAGILSMSGCPGRMGRDDH